MAFRQSFMLVITAAAVLVLTACGPGGSESTATNGPLDSQLPSSSESQDATSETPSLPAVKPTTTDSDSSSNSDWSSFEHHLTGNDGQTVDYTVKVQGLDPSWTMRSGMDFGVFGINTFPGFGTPAAQQFFDLTLHVNIIDSQTYPQWALSVLGGPGSVLAGQGTNPGCEHGTIAEGQGIDTWNTCFIDHPTEDSDLVASTVKYVPDKQIGIYCWALVSFPGTQDQIKKMQDICQSIDANT